MSFLPISLVKQLKHREKKLLIIPKTQRDRFLVSIKSYYKTAIPKTKLSQKQLKLLDVKTYNIKTVIRQDIVYLPIKIYCGNTWKTFFILPNIVGHSISSFISTRYSKFQKKN